MLCNIIAARGIWRHLAHESKLEAWEEPFLSEFCVLNGVQMNPPNFPVFHSVGAAQPQVFANSNSKRVFNVCAKNFWGTMFTHRRKLKLGNCNSTIQLRTQHATASTQDRFRFNTSNAIVIEDRDVDNINSNALLVCRRVGLQSAAISVHRLAVVLSFRRFVVLSFSRLVGCRSVV